MPKASVVIATYNWSSVLPYSIGSALDQTERDIEVLVVGDACTDDSEDVVRSMEDGRVRWINLPERFGHQAGPNSEGIRAARSDLVFYLSHDDVWMPHHVESFLKAFETGLDLVYGITLSVPYPGDLRLATPRLKPFRRGVWIPPTGLAHRTTVSDRIGYWRDYRQIDTRPEIDLVSRAVDAGFRIGLSPRLSAIKLPAIFRPGVYVDNPCHEQREWLERIRTEPDLEATLCGELLATAWEADSGLGVAEDAQRLARKVGRLVRKKLGPNRSIKKRIDKTKRDKGSDE